MAIGIGVVAALVALALLRLIGLFTNLFYFGRWSTALVSPVGNHLGVYSLLVPIGGALVIGLMARYGSERIRGHGIPEAIGDPHKWKPRRAEGGDSEADFLGYFDRLGRTFWRGRPHHHDWRRIWVDDRAVVSPNQRRAQNTAGGGRRGGNVGDVCCACRLGPASRGATAV